MTADCSSRKVRTTTVALFAAIVAGGGLNVSAAEPAPGTQFEGLWLSVPNRPRGPGTGAGRVPGGRGRGARADEKGLTPGDYRIRRMMTDAGQAAFDAFDPSQLPANNCESPGLPHIVMTPTLQEWRLDGNILRITHEYYSTKRAIPLEADPPRDIKKTPAGYATARFEEDSLEIETTALAATLGGLNRNAPSSDARVVFERYRLLPGGNAIEGLITIRDDKFLIRPIRLPVFLRRPEPGTELVLFPCDIEAARRHLEP